MSIEPLSAAQTRWLSLPVRGRGLKLEADGATDARIESLPVRGRGLKPTQVHEVILAPAVAPRAGAWIET